MFYNVLGEMRYVAGNVRRQRARIFAFSFETFSSAESDWAAQMHSLITRKIVVFSKLESIFGRLRYKTGQPQMVRDAIAKLEEALEIIDRHDIPLAGIHVANALTVLNERIDSDQSDAFPTLGNGRTGGAIN
jgi:hypothetical protein